MQKLMLVSLMALALALPAAAANAEPLIIKPPGTTPAESVRLKAATLPEARNETQAIINRAALARSVKRVIKAGETKALLEAEKAHPDPDVIYDIAKFASKLTNVHTSEHTNHAKPKKPKKGVTGPAEPSEGSAPEPIADRLVSPLDVRPLKPVAHSAGCWGSWAADTGYWWWGESVVAWTFADENGWCGDGYQITWLGGGTLTHWEWSPFVCEEGFSTNYTWDGSTAWVHMAAWDTVGVPYAWGCIAWEGVKAVVRIAANGYWDTYDDYGF